MTEYKQLRLQLWVNGELIHEIEVTRRAFGLQMETRRNKQNANQTEYRISPVGTGLEQHL